MESETASRDQGQRTKENEILRTGRPLVDGTPVDGPTLELNPESAASDRLRQSSYPLVSDPVTRTWATLLETPESGETDRPVLLQWVSPDSPEPPAHSHPTTETFEALEGQLTIVLEGDLIQLEPGESLTVEAGQEHTFRNETEKTTAFRAELPSMRTVKGLYSIWALGHERGRDVDGSFSGPGLVQSLVVAEELSTETRMTMAPLPVQRFLWATVGRVARLAGVHGIDDSSLDASFWEQHVEQPGW